MTRTLHNPLDAAQAPELVIDLHDGTNEQVSVIVPHYERPEFLNMCVQSIHVMSNLSNYEMIVVDNGSGQETQDYLDVLQEQGVKVVRNKENLMWSAAVNKGVSVADANSKYFIFLHCDTVVLNPSWMDVLVNISEANGSGLVGTQLQSYIINNQKYDFIQEWCMLMTRQCWNDCGPWPEELPLVGMSLIMTLRAQLAGYKPQAITNPVVHHYKQFCLSASEWDRLSEEAGPKIARLIQQAHKR